MQGSAEAPQPGGPREGAPRLRSKGDLELIAPFGEGPGDEAAADGLRPRPHPGQAEAAPCARRAGRPPVVAHGEDRGGPPGAGLDGELDPARVAVAGGVVQGLHPDTLKGPPHREGEGGDRPTEGEQHHLSAAGGEQAVAPLDEGGEQGGRIGGVPAQRPDDVPEGGAELLGDPGNGAARR